MTIQMAMEILGITVLNEDNLRKSYRDAVKLYHPDNFDSPMSITDREEMSKKINEAHEELEKYLKSNVNFDEYKNKFIYELENRILTNINGIFVEIKEVKLIQDLINSLRNETNLNDFNHKYSEVITKIDGIIAEYRNNLFNELNSLNSLNNEQINEVYEEYSKRMRTTDNIFTIYYAYQTGKQEIEKHLSNIKVTPDVLGQLINQFRATYLSNAIENKENQAINQLINSLIKDYSKLGFVSFERDTKQVKMQIEKIITDYYKKSFTKLEQQYKQAFLKFPSSLTAFMQVKLNNTKSSNIKQVDEVIYKAKVAVNDAIKKNIKNNLDGVKSRYQEHEHYKFIEKKVDILYSEILTSVERIVNNDWNYKHIFEKNIEQHLAGYKTLLAKKEMLIKELSEFKNDENTNDYLEKLTDCNEYDELENLIKKYSYVVEKMQKKQTNNKIKEFVILIKTKLDIKEQELLENLNFTAIEKNHRFYSKIISVLQLKDIEINFDILSQIGFEDLSKDGEILHQACKKKEPDYDLFANYFQKNEVSNTRAPRH